MVARMGGAGKMKFLTAWRHFAELRGHSQAGHGHKAARVGVLLRTVAPSPPGIRNRTLLCPPLLQRLLLSRPSPERCQSMNLDFRHSQNLNRVQ